MIRIFGFARIKQLPHLLASLNLARQEARELSETLHNCRRLNDSMADIIKEQTQAIRQLRVIVGAREAALREIVGKDTPHAAFAARRMVAIARKGLD